MLKISTVSYQEKSMDNYNNNGYDNGYNNNDNRNNNRNNNNNNKKPKNVNLIIFIIIAAVVTFIGLTLLSNMFRNATYKEISYDQFMQMIDEDKVKKVALEQDRILITPVEEEKQSGIAGVSYTYYTGYVNDDTLVPLLKRKGIEFEGYIPDSSSSIVEFLLAYVLPFLFIYIIFAFVYRRIAKNGGMMGGMGVGKSNAKVYVQKKPGVTFKDVAGQDEAKESLTEIVDFLHYPEKYAKIGAKLPKGALLVGPPGTGKTLLAKAVAGEADVPFFSLAGSDFVEMFVGVGASRVRDLFKEATKQAPCIIFIDEIDAIGKSRDSKYGGGNDEREQTLNQLLVEMDGFEDNDSVIVMAATNRRDILDPALLRPGRFDRQILVGYPDVKGREAILKVHTRNKPLAPDVDLETIAKSTVGFTGADLENLVNEASLLAARKNKKAITKDELEEASIKVVAGPEKKSKVITEDEKKLTAYHEGGHALCTYYSKSQDKVHQVSIIPRGQAGGFTMSLPVKDKSYVSKNEMYENIVVLLGGRVAEKLILDDISTGASNDLERATSTARNMVTRYGFSDNLGPVVYGQGDHEVFLGRDYTNTPSYSDNVAAEIDNEIRTLIESAFTDAEKILNEHMDKLHVVAKYLMKYEKVDGATFEKLMNGELTESEFMGEPDKTPEIQDTPEIVDDISVDDN